MRFVIDECTGPAVAKWLRTQGYDALSVYDQMRGSDDETVLRIAERERRVLITNDKDFGERVYRDRSLHSGVILLRLVDQSLDAKIAALERLLLMYADRIEGSFAVVSDKHVRFARPSELDCEE